MMSTQSPSTSDHQNGQVHEQFDGPRSASPDQSCCSICRCLRSIIGSPSRPKQTPPSTKPEEKEIIRLLMVGKGDVGKSTVVKQLQNLCYEFPDKYQMYDETWTIQKATFTLEDRQNEKQQVLRNILHCIGTLLFKVEEYGFDFDSDRNRQIAQRVSDHIGDVQDVLRSKRIDFDEDLARDIGQLWKDSGIQKAWERRREYTISDHATEYFLKEDKLANIASPDYVPSADDILRVRNPTRGTKDYNFVIEGTKFSFRDVGGQPVEISRYPSVISDWLNQCEVSTRKYILFIASLADYNQRLPDKPPKYTQLVDSMRLMQVLMNIENLRNAGFILFLNKRDLLAEKLHLFKDFYEHFPQAQPQVQQFRGGRRIQNQPLPINPEEAERTIGAQFHSAAQDTQRRDRPLFMHFTCATDKAQMDGIIGAVRVDILFKYMHTGIPFP